MKKILTCRAGHNWEYDKVGRGRPPVWCPEHKPLAPQRTKASSSQESVIKDPKIQTLYCRLGKHEWERESKKGKLPHNCPVHQPVPEEKKPRAEISLSRILERILSSPLAQSCQCGLSPQNTLSELKALGGGCTSKGESWDDHPYVCPTLDTIWRAIGV